MALAPTIIQLSVGIVLLVAVYLFLAPKKNTTALPPGPKPLPLLGNVADLPKAGVKEWEHWLKHKDLYGVLEPGTPVKLELICVDRTIKLCYRSRDDNNHH
jgi:hypothetical protein